MRNKLQEITVLVLHDNTNAAYGKSFANRRVGSNINNRAWLINYVLYFNLEYNCTYM